MKAVEQHCVTALLWHIAVVKSFVYSGWAGNPMNFQGKLYNLALHPSEVFILTTVQWKVGKNKSNPLAAK